MKKTKKALVTGGAGFIGSNLVEALVASDWEVTVLDDLSSGYKGNLSRLGSIRLIEGDVRDAASVREALRGNDVVFHLAASVGNKRSIDRPIEDAEINVIGTLRILEAARAARVRKVVVSSSAGIFGELKTLPIREDHPVEPDSPYGCTKLCEEKLALAYGKIYDLETVGLRYFNVFGRNQRFDAYGNVIPIFVFQVLRGETLTVHGDGEQTRDFVHVRDVVRANIGAAERSGLSGAFNIGSGTRISVNGLVDMIRRTSGREVAVKHGPARPGDVRDSLADIGAAHAGFGYEPSVGLEEGLSDYFEWARAEVSR